MVSLGTRKSFLVLFFKKRTELLFLQKSSKKPVPVWRAAGGYL